MKNVVLSVALLMLWPLWGLAQVQKNEAPPYRSNKRHTGQPLANLIRGPYLQVATSSSIIVRWRTDTWARSRVRYGTNPDSLNFTADDSALVMEHQVKLTGLQP